MPGLVAPCASDGPRGTSGCRNQCPWGRRGRTESSAPTKKTAPVSHRRGRRPPRPDAKASSTPTPDEWQTAAKTASPSPWGEGTPVRTLGGMRGRAGTAPPVADEACPPQGSGPIFTARRVWKSVCRNESTSFPGKFPVITPSFPPVCALGYLPPKGKAGREWPSYAAKPACGGYGHRVGGTHRSRPTKKTGDNAPCFSVHSSSSTVMLSVPWRSNSPM